jgi:hypothetical protein
MAFAVRALRLMVAVLLVPALTACALPRMIDSDVSSFIGKPAPVKGASYRLERLPSQTESERQKRIEEVATKALTSAGLRADNAQPQLAVTVTVQTEQFTRAPQRPTHGGLFFGMDGFIDSGFMLNIEPPWYRYTVQFLMRDIASSQITFESKAMHEGPWSDGANLLPLVMEAALRDYPNPPNGPRRVAIELPAQSRETR